MRNPLSEDRLAEIRRRMRANDSWNAGAMPLIEGHVYARDVYVLLAEVERLRAENAALREERKRA